VSTSLILSIAALVISVASGVFAGMSAAAARRSARAEEGTLAIERERRLEERRPRLTVKLDGTGEKRVLRITLDSNEALAGLDVRLTGHVFYQPPGSQGGWDCEFNPRVYGVVVPPPGSPSIHAYSYDPLSGERAGLVPHQTVSWQMNTKKRLEWVQLSVDCHGTQSEHWNLLIKVEAQPEIEDTIA